jgi:hypothetical protein
MMLLRRILPASCAFAAASALHASTVTVFDGVANDYVAGNASLGTPEFIRAAPSPNGPYYRFPDMNDGGAGTPFFNISAGNDVLLAAGPTLFGGCAWCDNARPDDTSVYAGTVGFYRASGGGTNIDTLRFYTSVDSGGITPDEGFGVALWDIAIPEGSELASLSITGKLGRADDATFDAVFRWAVVKAGAVYVFSVTFTLTTTSAQQTLSDVTATTCRFAQSLDPTQEIEARG